MILRSLRLEGIGCFADSITVGPLIPGVNIIHAPNGIGKSTLFRSVALGLLESHRSKTAEIQALRSWGRHLTPQVSIEFEHSGQCYRLRKRFLDGASSHVERKQGDHWSAFAQADSADEFLRELSFSESERARFTKPESWGLAQVLWATQGELHLPKFTPKLVEYIRASIGAHFAVQDAAIETRIESEYLKHFSPARGKLKSGKAATPQLKYATERDRLTGDLQNAEALVRQFETMSSSVEQFREKLSTLSGRKHALLPEQSRLRQAIDEYKALQSRRKERAAQRDEAQSRQKAIRDRIEAIQGCRKQVSELESALAQSALMVPSHRAKIDDLRGTLSAAEKALAVAVEAENQARRALATAHDAQEYVRVVNECSILAGRWSRIAEAHAQITEANAQKAGVIAPSDSEMCRLRGVLERERDLRRRLELARVSITFAPSEAVELTVVAGESPGTCACVPGSAISISGSPNLSFTVARLGRFDVSGPETNYRQIEEDLQAERLALSELGDQFGTTDPDDLETRRQVLSQINSGIEQATRALSELLAGEPEDTLRRREVELAGKANQIVGRYPEWQAHPPDATEFMKEASERAEQARVARNAAEGAERLARTVLASAELEMANTEATRKAQEDGVHKAKEMLAQFLCDGVADQQRQGDLDEAVLHYDGCRLALQQIECQLQAFGEDPASELDRIETEIGNLDGVLEGTKRSLIEAETTLSNLVQGQPYGQYAEISERLAVVAAELKREELHTSALALLRNTFQEVKAEMLSAVSAPVEKTATQYLEEICGKPLAEIQMTQNFAVQEVAPIELLDCFDRLVALDRLSGGEQEQVFLCARLALASELAHKEKQMLVLDDVLTYTDSERLPRICDLLKKLADGLQIILLTCHPERFEPLSSANRIDLQQLLASERRFAA